MRHPLTIRVLGKNNKAEKVEKKKSENYEQTICISTHHDQTSVKFQNDRPKTEGGVVLTRHPLTIRVLGKN